MMNEKQNEAPNKETDVVKTNETKPDEMLEAKPHESSRMASRKNKQEQREIEETPKRTFWVQLKILPIWLRLLLVIIILVAVAAIGLRFGYGYIGDGDPADVFQKETWTHILDIINGKE